MKCERIVITGGTGLLALNWAWLMRGTCDVCLFTHSHVPNIEGVAYKQVSLDDATLIERALEEFSPDVVIHTAGLTNVDECERSPEKAKLANTDIAINVAKACQRYGTKLVHISTDHLFAGNMPLMTEDAIPSPLNEYAKTKLNAERGVMAECDEALVIRTNFYGWGHRDRASFSDWIINSLRQHQQISVFTDVWFTPILIDHLVATVHGLVNLGLSGIYHVVGDSRIAKYDFSRKVASQFNLDQGLIKPTSIGDINLAASRPQDMSLSNQLAVKTLGYGFGNINDGILELFRQSQTDREKGLHGSVI